VALEILQQRGRLSAGTWRAYRQAGLGEALLVQICAWVGINSFSNWLNNLVEPKIDFPRVPLQ
ncbi:MAG: hypothetical protein JO171_09605, partial [Paludibacterium sp.]|nr:hypothetical protein [Paludibacterium sp.]